MIISIFSQTDDAESALNNLAEADVKTSNISVVMATKEQVCTPGYAKAVRNVPEEEKDEVYAEYGVTHHSPGEYEVDHHVSLELGGSNDMANLWPEAVKPRPRYHEKDKLENYLHKQVCDGKMSLEGAQKQIATNWLDVYKRLPNRTRRSHISKRKLR